jgi:soluble lytic murein transglycosylase-like protein
MQVRYSTAQWLGYTGDEVGLLLPDTNIEFGTKYLRYQLKRYGNTRDAIAAYNSGTVRYASSGLYRNQDYVDGVFDWYGKTKLIIPTLVLPLIN